MLNSATRRPTGGTHLGSGDLSLQHSVAIAYTIWHETQRPMSLPSQVIPIHSHVASSTRVVPPMHAEKGSTFVPPGVNEDYNFKCEYPAMVGWESYSTVTDRKCWFRRKSDGKQYDINTNYKQDTPIGINRTYTRAGKWYNDADGMLFTEAKLFNGEYPGRWIQAC